MLHPFFQQYLLNVCQREDTICYEAQRDKSDEQSVLQELTQDIDKKSEHTIKDKNKVQDKILIYMDHVQRLDKEDKAVQWKEVFQK